MSLKLLKKDVFGEVATGLVDGEPAIVRSLGPARWYARGLARRLMVREALALAVLDGMEGIPRLLRADPDSLSRSFIDGLPMQQARPAEPRYFRRAARLLRRLQSCASYVVGEARIVELRPQLTPLTGAADPILSETAARAAARLSGKPPGGGSEPRPN